MILKKLTSGKCYLKDLSLSPYFDLLLHESQQMEKKERERTLKPEKLDFKRTGTS